MDLFTTTSNLFHKIQRTDKPVINQNIIMLKLARHEDDDKTIINVIVHILYLVEDKRTWSNITNNYLRYKFFILILLYSKHLDKNHIFYQHKKLFKNLTLQQKFWGKKFFINVFSNRQINHYRNIQSRQISTNDRTRIFPF